MQRGPALRRQAISQPQRLRSGDHARSPRPAPPAGSSALARVAGVSTARMHEPAHAPTPPSSPRCSTPEWICVTLRSLPGMPSPGPNHTLGPRSDSVPAATGALRLTGTLAALGVHGPRARAASSPVIGSLRIFWKMRLASSLLRAPCSPSVITEGAPVISAVKSAWPRRPPDHHASPLGVQLRELRRCAVIR